MTMQIYNPRPALVKSFWCIFFEFFVSPTVDFVHPLLGVRCPQKKTAQPFGQAVLLSISVMYYSSSVSV